MKIFISHSSKNKFFGDKLVDLLRSIGIKENEIIYTSNTAYGIPVGENIYKWLRNQIVEKPFVIYLLSEEYYISPACLNEMGASWIIENKHSAIFTPNFDLSSKEFQSGALDPREIGFYINDEERILSFINLLSEDFEISKSHVIISQSVNKFLSEISENPTQNIKPIINRVNKISKTETPKKDIQDETYSNQSDLYSEFTTLIVLGKLNDSELILLHYIIDTGRFRLMTGWQEHMEINNIKEWEVINKIDSKLSNNYTSSLNRFEVRGFTEVSASTSSNNPKEVKIKDEISKHLLDLPKNILDLINDVISKSHLEYLDGPSLDDILPF